MVVFTCNHCGDSVQKPKAEKHYDTKCRNNYPNLCCVDCLKDFHGDEFKAHTKCVTEAERYGGKGFIPKPNQNKGEKKQNAWIEIVQSVLDENKKLSGSLRYLLEKISNQPNTPRKKPKFINFVRSMDRKATMKDIEAAWGLLSTKLDKLSTVYNAEKAQADKAKTSNDTEQSKKPKDSNSSDEAEQIEKPKDTNSSDEKKQTKKQKKNAEANQAVEGEPTKKKKKNKNKIEVDAEESEVPKKKKKKNKENVEENHKDGKGINEAEPKKKKNKNKEYSEANGSKSSEEESCTKPSKEVNGNKMDEEAIGSPEKETKVNGVEETSKEEPKLSKKELKEKRKREKYEAQLKEIQNYKKTEVVEAEESKAEESGKGKKSNKRKHEDIAEAVAAEDKAKEAENFKKSNKRKREEDVVEEKEEEQPVEKKVKKDGVNEFDWTSSILSVIGFKGKDISLKKLQKKVLGQYCSDYEVSEVSERVMKKFHKTLAKLPNVKVEKDKVYIMTEKK